MKFHRVKEYGKIKSQKDFTEFQNSDKEIFIPESSFNNLWNFILDSQSKSDQVEKAFKLYSQKGKRIIQVQNYVGLIEANNYDTIEILPKIYNSNGEMNLSESKNIFLKMLSKLKINNPLSFQYASLDYKEEFPILEVFIRSYITETERILLAGLKKDYINMQENSAFLKGKLIFQKHMLKNMTDRSKFYISTIKYLENIPQNRIIYSTLLRLNYLSFSANNRAKINNLLNHFGRLHPSENISEDLTKCNISSRLFADYKLILDWSRIFLSNGGFINFSGRHINIALLFPMEIIFQNFITFFLKKYSGDFRISSQHKQYFLITKHLNKGRFRLIPDIFAENISGDKPSIIIDTKWKIIDENIPNKNYFINQTDMYQLFAYGKKYTKEYGEPNLFLIYPMTDKFARNLDPFFYEENDGNYHLELRAIPFDLSRNYNLQIQNILESIGNNN